MFWHPVTCEAFTMPSRSSRSWMHWNTPCGEKTRITSQKRVRGYSAHGDATAGDWKLLICTGKTDMGCEWPSHHREAVSRRQLRRAVYLRKLKQREVEAEGHRKSLPPVPQQCVNSRKRLLLRGLAGRSSPGGAPPAGHALHDRCRQCQHAPWRLQNGISGIDHSTRSSLDCCKDNTGPEHCEQQLCTCTSNLQAVHRRRCQGRTTSHPACASQRQQALHVPLRAPLQDSQHQGVANKL